MMSRRLNLVGSGVSVSLLYVHNRIYPNNKYELLYVADNLRDLQIMANAVPPNMT